MPQPTLDDFERDFRDDVIKSLDHLAASLVYLMVAIEAQNPQIDLSHARLELQFAEVCIKGARQFDIAIEKHKQQHP